MSMKRMVTKLALAFAAKKGMEAFRAAGGIDGLKSTMVSKQRAAAEYDDLRREENGAHTGDSTTLSGVLDSLGLGSKTGQTSPLQGTLGGLFGTLAAALGDRPQARDATNDLDTQFDVNDIKTDDEARAIMRAMVHMTRADGAIDAQEQSALFEILEDASSDERAALQDAMREPVDAKSIAAETPRHARKEVYTAALLLGSPNVPQERAFLAALAQALGLRDGELNDLHNAVGKPQMALG